MIGQVITHYRILKELGKGGMGVVYLAEDLRLHRVVALKFLPPELTDDSDARQRLVREAQAASSLQHPNICTIHDIDQSVDGRMFVVMDYYEGEPLSEKIKQGPLQPAMAVSIAVQIAQGLGKAHEKGITHRDIKPANIMLTTDGTAKILDFGIAKQVGSKTTTVRSLVGTTAYMSPEQIRAEFVDNRTDIWALGVVLYEMITGAFPFKGERLEELLYSIQHDLPTPATGLPETIPGELEQVTGRCLEKDPARRYQTVYDLLNDLQHLRESPSGIRQHSLMIKGRQGFLSGAARLARTINSRAPVSLFAGGTIVLTLLAVALAVFGSKRWSQVLAGDAEAKQPLVVMPFDNVRSDKSDDVLSDILTRLLISSLSQSQAFEVLSRERLMEIQRELGGRGGRTPTPSLARQVARHSGASLMISGTIIQASPLEVTCQLIDVESGALINAGNFRGFAANDVFALVDSVARLVERALRDRGMPPLEIKPVREVTTSSLEAYRAYVEGHTLLNRAYFRESHSAFRKAVELDSSFAMSYYWLSRLAAPAGMDGGSMALQKAWELRSNVTVQEQLIIEARYASIIERNPAKTAEILSRIAREFPQTKGIYSSLGGAYRSLLEADKSIEAFRKSALLEPLNRQSWNPLAYAYAIVGQKDSALSASRQAISLQPAYADVYDSHGDIFHFFGELDSAESYFSKAMAMRPGFASDKHGCLLLLKREYGAAEQSFLEGAALYNSPPTWYEDGVLLGRALIGLHQGRIKALQKATEEELGIALQKGIKQEIIRKRWLLLVTSYELGDWTRMVDVAPDIATSRDTEVWALAACGRIQEADALARGEYDKIAVKIKPTEAAYWHNQGIIAFCRGDHDEAVSAFRKVDALLPSNRPAMYFYAVSLLKSGNPREAVAELKMATWKYPFPFSFPFNTPQVSYWAISSVKAHYWLGVAYEQLGERQKAITEYETFLDTWREADFESPEIADASNRLLNLKSQMASSREH